MSEERVKVVIDREKWIRGRRPGDEPTALLRESDNRMCCLGFCALALGAKREQILGVGEPCDAGFIPRLTYTARDFEDDGNSNTPAAVAAITVNDDDGTNDTDREDQLTKILGAVGLDLEFVGPVRP
jgi:hypothetical protein